MRRRAPSFQASAPVAEQVPGITLLVTFLCLCVRAFAQPQTAVLGICGYRRSRGVAASTVIELEKHW